MKRRLAVVGSRARGLAAYSAGSALPSALILVLVGYAIGTTTEASPLSALLLLGVVGTATLLSRAQHEEAPVPAAATGGWQVFERELSRARRYGRRLTLLRLEPAPGDREDDLSDLVPFLSEHLRTVDSVWEQNREVWVLMPEGDRGMAISAVGRVETLGAGLLSRAIIRSATFPDDALTAGALLAAVHGEGEDLLRLPIHAQGEGAMGHSTTPSVDRTRSISA